ncbi:hypothetical protein [Sinorhizobium americanum]|uniref:hypothetical protein n=1 Tax=Sinorhizobium americanum TaxID=194963 RepID=UPI001049F7DC|nr:hypothetical protein [Sinorhizobium americanum]
MLQDCFKPDFFNTISGNPISIATTQHALRNEFFERTVVHRSPVPVVFGKGNDGESKVRLQPNDIRAQVFDTKEPGDVIAWSVIVTNISYNGTLSTLGAAKTAATRIRQNASSNPVQQQKLRDGAVGDRNNAERDAYSSQTGDPSHMIRVFIQSSALSMYRQYPDGFGTSDVIGYDPSLVDRIRDLFR